MVKRILFIIGITVIAFMGFTLLSQNNSADNEHADHEEEHGEEEFQNIPLTEQQVAAVNLKMGEAERRELDAVINVNGQLVLRPQSIGEVSSLMGGVVKSMLVKDGQQVSRGQIVATIENTDIVQLQREYFSACREAEMARIEMERQQQLASNGAGVKKNLQQAQKDYKIAQASMTGTGKQLQQMGISTHAVAQGRFTTVFPLRSPISGTVSQITASLGSYADMQTPLMKIRDNSAVECDLNVFEKDLQKVKIGDRVTIALTNQNGAILGGKVYGMNKYFNDGTKAVAVHVKLDRTSGNNVFDGMYVSGQIATGRQECNTLPSRAIVNTDGKNYIFALNKKPKEGKYEFSRHEVTTGVSQNGYTEVLLCEHIKKGQKIVTDNAFYLASMTSEHGEHAH